MISLFFYTIGYESILRVRKVDEGGGRLVRVHEGYVSTFSKLKFDVAVTICLWMIALHTVHRTFNQKLDMFFKLRSSAVAVHKLLS